MDNEFGKFIRALRGKESLRAISERSNLSHTHIRDLELGMNRNTKVPIKPSFETIKSLAKAFDLPYTKLMIVAGYVDGEDEEKSAEESLSEAKRKKGRELLDTIKEERLDNILFLLEQLNKE